LLPPPATTGLPPEPLPGRRGGHPCGPDPRLARDALPTDDDPLLVDPVHGLPEPNLDSETLQPRLRSLREIVGERSEDPGAPVDQDDARSGGVDAPELLPEAAVNPVGDGRGHLD